MEHAQGSIAHWDAFWRVRDKAGAFDHTGVRDQAFPAFWKQIFACELANSQPARLIDIACGNGAVTMAAVETAQAMGASLNAHCVDFSFAALSELRRQLPQVQTVVGDARALPYSDGTFGLVVSQFGIEYAGETAFREAARLVSAGGCLTALLHCTGGAIHDECAANLAMVRAVKQSMLVPRAREAFRAGFERIADRRRGNLEFQVCSQRLVNAVEAAKEALPDKPSAFAGFVANVLRDVGYMLNRIQNFAPGKVFEWLDLIAGELASYEGRMLSMTEAAMGDEAIARVAGELSSAGFSVNPPAMLSLKEFGRSAGWILFARRNA